MNKTLFTASLLSVTLLTAPIAHAGGNQDRAAATGAVVGATTGAVIGAQHHRVLQGAVIGAVFGTITGAIIAGNHRITHVVYRHPVNHRRVEAERHDHRRCVRDVAYNYRMHQRHERMEERREHARELYQRHERREDSRRHADRDWHQRS